MAYISGYPGDEEDELEGEGGEGAPGAGAGGGSAFVGGGGAGAPGGAPQAKGTGGMGAFTNLQSYLNANKSDPNSARILGEQFGKTFQGERDRFDTESGAARSGATSAADAGQIDTSNMASDLERLYGGGGDEGSLAESQQRMGTYKFGSYNPSQFGFQVGGDAAALGENLGSEEGFRRARTGAYQKMGGSPYTVGMSALQNQLDVVNPEVQNARQAALQGYASLQGDTAKGTEDTNKFIGEEGARFQAGQDKFRGDVTGLQGQYNSTMQDYLGKVRGNQANYYEINKPTSVGGIFEAPKLENLKGISSTRDRYNALSDIVGGQQLAWQPSNIEYENFNPNTGLTAPGFEVGTPGLGYGGMTDYLKRKAK